MVQRVSPREHVMVRPTLEFLGIASMALCCLSACDSADPNAKANALFVEATVSLKNATKAHTDADARSLYKDGTAKLDMIVANYPTSSLAVQLASGQQIGEFSRSDYQARLQASVGMKPTLLEGMGRSLVVLRYAAGAKPKRGDIIAYRLPNDPLATYIRRLIGLPGERIHMNDGILYINNQSVPRQPVEDFVDTDGTRIKQWRETLPNGINYFTLKLPYNLAADNTDFFEVPLGQYFLLGDNRNNSTDSRWSIHGYVPVDNVIARVISP